MCVLVTGASGFLGQHLVRRLVENDNDVRVLVRSEAKAKVFEDKGIEAIVGEITDHEVVREALSGVSIVYHLAGRLLDPDVPSTEYYQVHVEGTRNLVDRCLERSTITRFVHCSTTGVLGPTGDQGADELAVAAPTNVYELTKWQAELLVRDASCRGLPTVIVRPAFVYGPGDLHLLNLFRAVQRQLFRPIGRRPVWLHPIYVDDLTAAWIRCVEVPQAVGECFHIAGAQPVTTRELGQVIAQALGVPSHRESIPLPVMMLLMLAGEHLLRRMKLPVPLTGSALNMLTQSRTYKIDRARQILDFFPSTDLTTGITRTVYWYRKYGYLPSPHMTLSGQQAVG